MERNAISGREGQLRFVASNVVDSAVVPPPVRWVASPLQVNRSTRTARVTPTNRGGRVSCNSGCANCKLDCLALHDTDPETQEYLRQAISSISTKRILVQRRLDQEEEW